MTTIYESPDHGETVFARMAGSLVREKVSESAGALRRAHWHKWQDILLASEDNVALADLISQAESIYELTK